MGHGLNPQHARDVATAQSERLRSKRLGIACPVSIVPTQNAAEPALPGCKHCPLEGVTC